jgi:hypothetical protein
MACSLAFTTVLSHHATASIVPALQEHVVEVAIAHHFRQAAMPAVSFKLVHGPIGLPKGQAFIERGMRSG